MPICGPGGIMAKVYTALAIIITAAILYGQTRRQPVEVLDYHNDNGIVYTTFMINAHCDGGQFHYYIVYYEGDSRYPVRVHGAESWNSGQAAVDSFATVPMDAIVADVYVGRVHHGEYFTG